MKKESIVRKIARFISIYDGDSEEENIEFARQIVAQVKRHLTKRPPDTRKSAPKSRSKTSKGSAKPARGQLTQAVRRHAEKVVNYEKL